MEGALRRHYPLPLRPPPQTTAAAERLSVTRMAPGRCLRSVYTAETVYQFSRIQPIPSPYPSSTIFPFCAADGARKTSPTCVPGGDRLKKIHGHSSFIHRIQYDVSFLRCFRKTFPTCVQGGDCMGQSPRASQLGDVSVQGSDLGIHLLGFLAADYLAGALKLDARAAGF